MDNVPGAEHRADCRTSSKPSSSCPASQPPEYEFMGPWIGPLGIMVGLPVVAYGLVYTCNAAGCSILKGPATWPGFPPGTQLFTWQALGVYVGWILAQAVLHILLPGQRALGVRLANGRRLRYKLTGMRNLTVTLAVLGYFSVHTRQLDLGWVYDNYVPLLTSSLIVSWALALYLYAASFREGALLSKPGSTGHPLYDFFMGRELNPRLGGAFDLKEFCELYPGLIGWLAIDLGMAHKQWQDTGAVSAPLALVCAFHAWYVTDALWGEAAILTTMDITADGFGWMLAAGDLFWVPFTYSLQARYLVDHPKTLSLAGLAGILAVKAVGYAIFRGSNSQKNAFRTNPEAPSVRRLKTLKTASGRRLIISGWWGVARHINYFGDWLIGWTWCLPCGFDHLVPYFYVIYFAALLVHRDLRDEHACALKYGKDWDRYCKIVRYRIVPFLY